MCIILQSGGHGHSHGHTHSSVTTASPRRTARFRRPRDAEDRLSVADSHDDVVTLTARMTSPDESRNINVKAAFIHVIGDLLQSFGVLVAAYIIFYKVACQCWPQGQFWAGRTPPPNNPPPNMAATNFVVITKGEGCALNGTAFAAVLINQ